MDNIQLLKSLLEIYSPSTKESKAVDFLVGEMEKLGFKTYKDEVGNAVGEIGEGETEILLVGHIDTVPGFIEVEQKGDLLYGRGSVDATGPLVTFVCAAARAAAQCKHKIIVVGAVEEEIHTSKGARNLIGKYNPEAIVIGEPSGVNKITLGYKGRLRANYELTLDIGHTAGNLANVNEMFIDFFNTLKAYCDEWNQEKSIFQRLDLTLQGIKTSTNDFQDTIQCDIGFRVPLDCDIEAVKTYMMEHKGEAKVDFYGEEIPYKEGKSNPLVRSFLKSMRALELQPKFVTKTGTSDMNTLAPHYPGVPIVAYGAGDSSLDHTPHEHVSVTEFQKSIDVLAEVLVNL